MSAILKLIKALTDSHSDMSSNFFSLPRGLRDRISELVLFHQELIAPRIDYDRR